MVEGSCNEFKSKCKADTELEKFNKGKLLSEFDIKQLEDWVVKRFHSRWAFDKFSNTVWASQ